MELKINHVHSEGLV